MVTRMAFSLTAGDEKDGSRQTAKIRANRELLYCTCCWFVTLALGKVCCTFRAVFESQGLIEMSNLSFRGRPQWCFV